MYCPLPLDCQLLISISINVICIFFSEVFANSPFLISAEVAGALDGGNNDDYKETTVPAGKTHEVSLSVDSINSYIAWDFSLVQGKINLVSFLNFISLLGECVFFFHSLTKYSFICDVNALAFFVSCSSPLCNSCYFLVCLFGWNEIGNESNKSY
ncbi:uncharacterized protein LOC133735687 [Rosa rugosa]|uniref:uncharacterized protein LOC133735687 n=1 Tax=Rosa rugosa TaxID=74645 RepID=UPI002B404EBF|nr:uncharacterized protein LOC133735687 [Rosa rugosa]